MKFLIKPSVVAFLLLPAFYYQLKGQQQPLGRVPQRPEVVTVTTNLVQIDVTVVGRDGQPVSDLKADDFEVFEDGKPQSLTHFSFVLAPTGQPQPVTVTRPARSKNTVLDPPLP